MAVNPDGGFFDARNLAKALRCAADGDLTNCLTGNADEGVTVAHQASLEVSACRISNCRVGLALRDGASCAVYDTRVETCVGTDESDPGVGIFAEQSNLYCEGATLMGNASELKWRGKPLLIRVNRTGL